MAGLRNDIDEIETQVFLGDPGVSRRIYQLSREVIEFQRAARPLLDLRDVADHATAVAAILFAPNLIGTVYGMNFRHMPELEWAAGYPMSLGLMAVVCGALYVAFKRRGWL
ncbi:CorA family divalent cation transporter [Phytohabitans sp. ZYX-F-186]|uniref:CorA family divalent cation transporter n=1 Tax=Phytohabitans maris TaxID=3071409 RepID=A0ABU0ZTP1_9ACTN|nr:CorA family divalent cation transporter [Phytohabitans sp. ZYX-F-186]MDQ7910408.1 CorA family divalent cation transporter [Phytohabitans sp. ZYX-F-186]